MHPRHASQELSPTNEHESEPFASFLHGLRVLDAAQSPPKSKALATPNRDLRLDMNFWTDSERLFEIMEPEKQSEFDALSSISESSGRSDCEFSPGAVLTPPVSVLFYCHLFSDCLDDGSGARTSRVARG